MYIYICPTCESDEKQFQSGQSRKFRSAPSATFLSLPPFSSSSSAISPSSGLLVSFVIFLQFIVFYEREIARDHRRELYAGSSPPPLSLTLSTVLANCDKFQTLRERLLVKQSPGFLRLFSSFLELAFHSVQSYRNRYIYIYKTRREFPDDRCDPLSISIDFESQAPREGFFFFFSQTSIIDYQFSFRPKNQRCTYVLDRNTRVCKCACVYTLHN